MSPLVWMEEMERTECSEADSSTEHTSESSRGTQTRFTMEEQPVATRKSRIESGFIQWKEFMAAKMTDFWEGIWFSRSSVVNKHERKDL